MRNINARINCINKNSFTVKEGTKKSNLQGDNYLGFYRHLIEIITIIFLDKVHNFMSFTWIMEWNRK